MNVKGLSDAALLQAYESATAKARRYDWYRMQRNPAAARRHRDRAAAALAEAKSRGLAKESNR